MRVGLFTNNYFPRLSGVAVAVDFLDRAVQQQGHETLIVAPDYGHGDPIPEERVVRVASVAWPTRNLAFPLARLQRGGIRRAVRRWQPQLVHSHHPFLIGESALTLADELGVPLVYTFHTLYEFFAHYVMLDIDPVRAAIRQFVVEYIQRCDLVIAPTEPIRQYLLSLGVRTRAETVPTGIDFARFQQVCPAQVAELRERWGLGAFEGVLLSVGRITKEKNVLRSVQALAELVARGWNLALLMVGDGPDMDKLRRAAEELGVGRRLILSGMLDQAAVATAYFLGDIFLFPSLVDTQGIVLYEAQAAGLPIVATHSMASEAAVVSGENGLFAADEPQAFAASIAEILRDRAAFARPFHEQRFSLESLGARYDQLYREVVAAGRAPPETKSSRLRAVLAELSAVIGPLRSPELPDPHGFRPWIEELP